MFYSKVNIDDNLFEKIKIELRDSQDWSSIKKMVWVPPSGWLESECPISHQWIESVREREIQFIRFHLTPAFGKLNIHIDGTLENPRVHALNIPVINYENALMRWYDYSDKSNWKNDYVEPREELNNAKGGVPINPTKCVVVDKTIIDRPTFLRTDTPHSIDNPNDGVRVILSVRFK
tara:strand:+ start:2358 stop:2888 length:531 start_codon:yes stop_codon:yes gene_type:complete